LLLLPSHLLVIDWPDGVLSRSPFVRAERVEALANLLSLP
jgi:hypothetical protein